MKPRQLRYLRAQDLEGSDAERPDFEGIPVKYEVISQWFKFCSRLAERQFPSFELLTVDFNFEHDHTTPRTTKIFSDSANRARLSRIGWHPTLLNEVGPVSGILMGATLVGLNAQSDLPCGAALHTGYVKIMVTDFASTMLVAQVLQLCGQPLRATDTASLLEQTIAIIDNGEATAEKALVQALLRFREELLRRLQPAAKPRFSGSP